MKKFLPTVIALSILILPLLVSAATTVPTPPNSDASNLTICCGKGSVVDLVIDWMFYILIILAVLFILYAAITFITARGDPEKITTARNFVLYALIGVIIGVLAEGLIKFVAQAVGGSANIQ